MTRSIIIIISLLGVLAMQSTVRGYSGYDLHVAFLQTVTKDIVKLLPRAMAYYVYQNEYDFFRGITFMLRNMEYGPRKLKDPEEIRREAYERLMRDIPYCIEAFKGGEIKQDSSHANIAGRLGMIAYSIYLLKLPDVPDLQYLQRFRDALEELVVDNEIELRIYYDGFQDHLSLGELMDRLRPEFMLSILRPLNKEYVAQMREDPFSMFRAPDRRDIKLVLTDRGTNEIYGATMNGILDAYVFIWKSSGMDLGHPSYAAPPNTAIFREARRSSVRQARSGKLGTRSVNPLSDKKGP
ncbi:MAG: hypothetical protein QG577_861 [Thermodesulfobacteriota bacterium]|nr:hypothetical protein [Thermodesulfobacteriota bacterium]